MRQVEPLVFFESYYVDNSYLLTLSRREAEKATSLVVKNFYRFGLKIHFDIRSAGKASKTEAFFIPKLHRGYKSYSEIPPYLVADIDLDPKFP